MLFRGSYRAEIYLCGFNPFSSAWLRLKICWTNFKKCCRDDNSEDDDDDDDDNKYLNKHSNEALLVEAVLESAPQFIIQLYAMTVQQEPVKIIQMISVPVSFLSLAWAFTAYDFAKSDIFVGQNVKQKVVLFANYLFVLSSRLFAIAFFTITYKWWIITVLMIHTVLLLIADISWSYGKGVIIRCFNCLNLIFGVHWLRDDISIHWLRFD